MAGCKVAVVAVLAGLAHGCSRAYYEDASGRFYTGRTMDWKEPTQEKVWVFPRGILNTLLEEILFQFL